MNDHYTGALLEDISHKLDAILEGEDSLATISREVKNIDKRLIRVETDVKIIRGAVTDHSRTLRNHTNRLDNHKRRIGKLERVV